MIMKYLWVLCLFMIFSCESQIDEEISLTLNNCEMEEKSVYSLEKNSTVVDRKIYIPSHEYDCIEYFNGLTMPRVYKESHADAFMLVLSSGDTVNVSEEFFNSYNIGDSFE